jgi:ADP-ribose pyrophosphatase YjhB (NUDIX family)
VLGVNVAVVAGGRVLLTLREDFEVWCLPGGQVEAGESLAEAGRREVLEETGLETRIDRFVGMYSRPRWADGAYHVALFAATAVGGALNPQPDEVLEMGYFEPDALPRDLLVGQRRRIRDATSDGTCVAHSSAGVYPVASREEALRARDASPLSRSAFYAEHIAGPNAALEASELAAGEGER